ncbi:hypothetical protein [Bradyrhizobium sp. Ai1a-2]|uniref:hypothetical protein n=1 Tax=Bradyrhizobium sp. Ai1a-2 TaxID=196490 RepID=UPI0007E8D5EA
MFEIGIFCVILLAAGYAVAMWVIGRRADVLHGKFVEPQPELEAFGIGPLVPPPAQRPNAESLQALLTVIQQDLNDSDPAGSEGYRADLPRRPNLPPSLRAARRG